LETFAEPSLSAVLISFDDVFYASSRPWHHGMWSAGFEYLRPEKSSKRDRAA